ncbi:MAG TPA: membrane protein insertion efficiency factor YidD [Pseudomonadales bacterium]|nr:membrane protein insertion efficiency factor YidD [Pseudomonadales bacterium]
MTKVLIRFIKLYRLFLSPWIGNQCRFYPTCSHYAEEAIIKHGPLRGTWLTACRLSCCHPWHKGGLDPVPDHFSFIRTDHTH